MGIQHPPLQPSLELFEGDAVPFLPFFNKDEEPLRIIVEGQSVGLKKPQRRCLWIERCWLAGGGLPDVAGCQSGLLHGVGANIDCVGSAHWLADVDV